MSYTAVTTVYNNETEILQYLNNMWAQTLPPDQIVVADGGSCDRTLEIIRKYIIDNRCNILLLDGKRLNIAEGFNEAIKNTNGNIIAITAIGNKYASNYFESLHNFMIESNCDICYGPIRGSKNNDFQIEYANTYLNGEKGEISPIGTNHGTLIKRNVIMTVGYFYEQFYYAGEDTEFYQRAFDRGFKSNCVENAYMEWDTPHDLKSFLKQIRVYTIARMQISPNLLLICEFIKISSPIWLLILSLFFPKNTFIIILVFVVVVHGLKAYKLKQENKKFKLWFVKRYYQIFNEIKYCKYLKKKYKVDRTIKK